MATQQPSAAILSAGSTATLDILDLLSSGPSESLLSTGLDLLPAVESSHSFDNIPPFPTTAKPLIFIPDLGSSLLYSTPSATLPADATRALTAVPTGPRLKVMMMEILSVEAWNVRTSFVLSFIIQVLMPLLGVYRSEVWLPKRG